MFWFIFFYMHFQYEHTQFINITQMNETNVKENPKTLKMINTQQRKKTENWWNIFDK